MLLKKKKKEEEKKREKNQLFMCKIISGSPYNPKEEWQGTTSYIN
jgi:hypothetical protein